MPVHCTVRPSFKSLATPLLSLLIPHPTLMQCAGTWETPLLVSPNPPRPDPSCPDPLTCSVLEPGMVTTVEPGCYYKCCTHPPTHAHAYLLPLSLCPSCNRTVCWSPEWVIILEYQKENY